MADNLKIQQQINEAIKERQALLVRQTKEIQTQVELSHALNTALSGAGADEILEDLENMHNSLEKAIKGARDLGSSQEDAFKKGSVSWAKSSGLLNKFTKGLIGGNKKLLKFGTVGAMAGLQIRDAFKQLLANWNILMSVGGTVTSTIFNMAKAIVSIPFKMLDGLVGVLEEMKAQMREIMQATEDVRASFGGFHSDISMNVMGAVRNANKQFAQAGMGIRGVLGLTQEVIKFFREAAEGMGATMHLVGDEFRRNSGQIAIFAKGMGITGEELKGFAERAILSGGSMTRSLQEVNSISLQLGSMFGMSSKLIAKDVGKMVKDIGKFGSLTVKEMAKAAVWTRKLGLEMKDLLGVIDKFDNFEDAATSVSNLSQAFGIQLDAYKMMQEQDPTKRIDMMRKAFFRAGKSAEKMTRQELALLSAHTGLDMEAAKVAFSVKNQGVSWDRLGAQTEAVAAKQMDLKEGLQGVAKNVERIPLMAKKGGFLSNVLQGFQAGIKWNSKFTKVMFNLNSILRQGFEAGKQLGRAFTEAFPGVKTALESMAKLTDPKMWRKKWKGMGDAFAEFFKAIADPAQAKGAVEKLFKSLSKAFVTEADKKGAQGFIKGFEIIFRTTGHLIGAAIKVGAKFIGKLFQGIAAYIRGGEALEAFKKQAGVGGKLAGEIFGPIVDAVKSPEVTGALLDGIKALGGAMLGAIVDFAKSPTGKKVGLAILAFLNPFKLNPFFIAGQLMLGAGAGINKFGDEFIAKFGMIDGKVGAAAAGIFNAFTFGLFSPETVKKVGSAAAGMSKTFFGFIEKHLGKEATEKIKDVISSMFDAFGSLSKVIKSLFSKDTSKRKKAFQDLGKKMMKTSIKTFKFVFTTLPKYIGKFIIDMVPKLATYVTAMLSRVLGTAADFLAGAVGEIANTLGRDSMIGQIFSGLEWVISKLATGLNELGTALFDAFKKMKGFSLTNFASTLGWDDVKRWFKFAIDDAANFAADILTSIAAGLSSAGEQIKESLGDAFSAAWKFVKEDIFKQKSPSREAMKVGDNLTKGLVLGMKDLPNAMAKNIGSPVVSSLTKELDAAKQSMKDLHEVSLTSKLGNIGTALGLGANNTVTIDHKNINLTINMQVVMDAGQVAEVLIDTKRVLPAV